MRYYVQFCWLYLLYRLWQYFYDIWCNHCCDTRQYYKVVYIQSRFQVLQFQKKLCQTNLCICWQFDCNFDRTIRCSFSWYMGSFDLCLDHIFSIFSLTWSPKFEYYMRLVKLFALARRRQSQQLFHFLVWILPWIVSAHHLIPEKKLWNFLLFLEFFIVYF